MVAIMGLHDLAIHQTTEEEKDFAKAYVAQETCEEWSGGHLLADGTKLPVFGKPGLHGETWFDKNKNYSIDCQVCDRLLQPTGLKVVSS